MENKDTERANLMSYLDVLVIWDFTQSYWSFELEKFISRANQFPLNVSTRVNLVRNAKNEIIIFRPSSN